MIDPGFRKMLEKVYDDAYKTYSEEWARTFEQGPFRPPWYKRLWRWLFPSKAYLSGFGDRK